MWQIHQDRGVAGVVVMPEERLSWPRTIGIGLQHLVAMFGATILVPLLTGFPPSTTIFFSGIGTLLFLAVVGNQVPSYLGSSFAFISPVIAAKAGGGMPAALGGICAAGALFFLVGIVVQRRGARVVDALMPPVVTGAVVALIGLNLAPAAWDNVKKDPLIALATLAAILVIGVGVRGFAGRLSVFLGVLAGYVLAAAAGRVDWSPVAQAAWVGLPPFTAPAFDLRAIVLVAPVVIVLVAENAGHVKAVAAMTGRDLSGLLGRAFVGDGLATLLAGLGGGSGTTTYAENIGVMAATRVYSTAAYVVAGLAAMLLALCPKVGAAIGTIPAGVLGGATTLLYGMIAVVGARIWIEAKVDFREPVNLFTAAVAMVVGAANYTVSWAGYEFNGIVLGTFGAVVTFQLLRALAARQEKG